MKRESWGFSVGDNGASMVGDFMWFGPMKRFQKLFFHTPLVNVVHLRQRGLPRLLPLAAEGPAHLRDVEASTTWGRLFAAYERGEGPTVLRARASGAAE